MFAAASLTAPFRVLEQRYEADHPGVEVELNLAGSQLLASQLIEGAPADLFASADPSTLARVAAERELAPGSRQEFASNRLVIVISSGGRDERGPPIEAVEDLAAPGVDLVLAGPAVPLGRYTRAALDQLGLRAQVEANLVSVEDSVNGVLTKVALGEADAGIAYASDLARSSGLRSIELPDAVEVVARYELAILADGPSVARGREFAALVTSPEGAAVLREHGFAP